MSERALICVIDGMTDECYDVRSMPNLNNLIQLFDHGALLTTPDGFATESYSCIATILGVKTHELPRHGRSWFESLGAGIEVPADALITRASWVALDENDCAIGITEPPDELPKLDANYYSLGGYRSLLVFDGLAEQVECIETFPPFAHVGEPLTALLPRCCPEAAAAAKKSRAGQKILIPWGQAVKCALPIIDVKAAAVSATGLVLGLCRARGIETVRPEGATGDTDTALEKKLECAKRLLNDYEIVLLHINGADEAAHRKNKQEKAAFLRKVDEVIISKLSDVCERVLICSDHGTSPETGRHIGGAQPFVLTGSREIGDIGTLGGCKGLELLLK